MVGVPTVAGTTPQIMRMTISTHRKHPDCFYETDRGKKMKSFELENSLFRPMNSLFRERESLFSKRTGNPPQVVRIAARSHLSWHQNGTKYAEFKSLLFPCSQGIRPRRISRYDPKSLEHFSIRLPLPVSLPGWERVSNLNLACAEEPVSRNARVAVGVADRIVAADAAVHPGPDVRLDRA